MPSIAQAAIPHSNSKKRRRDDVPNVEVGVQMKLSSPRHYSASYESPRDTGCALREEIDLNGRYILPKPKRTRMLFEVEEERVKERNRATTATDANNRNATDLSPCHICRRKPTVRSELDAFADCEGCEMRTCYICIRECEGDAMEMGMRGTVRFEDMCEMGEAERRKGAWVMRNIRGHRRMVCSRCCVERGTEGEVRCLGCLRVEELE